MLIDGSHDFAWIANSHRIGWDILGYYTTSANDTIFSNSDTWTDNAASSNPAIVFNPYWITIHILTVLRIDGMSNRSNGHCWPKHNALPDNNFVVIYKIAVKVDI